MLTFSTCPVGLMSLTHPDPRPFPSIVWAAVAYWPPGCSTADGGLCSCMFTPTQASLARSKSTAALSTEGTNAPGNLRPGDPNEHQPWGPIFLERWSLSVSDLHQPRSLQWWSPSSVTKQGKLTHVTAVDFP